MAAEIERRFLVIDDGWRADAVGVPIRQGYLSSGAGVTVRVRVEGSRGTLTVKGPPRGLSRDEFEYPVPLEDAREMLDRLCGERIVRKTRYRVSGDSHVWLVDEFHDANDGLTLAEVELGREDEAVDLPSWVGEEVSSDRRYTNAALAARPWSEWSDASH